MTYSVLSFNSQIFDVDKSLSTWMDWIVKAILKIFRFIQIPVRMVAKQGWPIPFGQEWSVYRQTTLYMCVYIYILHLYYVGFGKNSYIERVRRDWMHWSPQGYQSWSDGVMLRMSVPSGKYTKREEKANCINSVKRSQIPSYKWEISSFYL